MNILITGASGFIGSQLVEALQQRNRSSNEKVTIFATDVKEVLPFKLDDYTKYFQIDVRSSDLKELVQRENIQSVVHLASIVTPGKKSNREFEYSVDVEGTQNVLEACVAHNVRRIIVTSSGAAYGYYSDNPQWIKETDAIRGNEEFPYSYHKRLVEEMLAHYRKSYPQLEQVIFRIGTILGKNVNNQITNLFEKRFLIGVRHSDSPFVFIWDEDIVQCLVKGIFDDETGIYNVAGNGYVTIDEIGAMLQKKVIRFPVSLLKIALFILKRLRLTQYGEEQLNFLRYRPVLDNEKLRKQFNYTPKHSSKEAFQMYMKQRQN